VEFRDERKVPFLLTCLYRWHYSLFVSVILFFGMEEDGVLKYQRMKDGEISTDSRKCSTNIQNG
jgi:hypothetical protein